MTNAEFLAFYPQFQIFQTGVVLPEYLRQANARFSDFGEDADEARRLYVAHKLTLYSSAAMPDGVSPSMSRIADAGMGVKQMVSSRKVDDVAVSYAETTFAKNFSSDLYDLTETTFGLQLLSLIKLHSYSRYAP